MVYTSLRTGLLGAPTIICHVVDIFIIKKLWETGHAIFVFTSLIRDLDMELQLKDFLEHKTASLPRCNFVLLKKSILSEYLLEFYTHSERGNVIPQLVSQF